ncbi:hypothetical protein BJ138DRAFT_1198829 [Hygrophoropsis aurantiaca]|uniref:Uncharacterized protein n=1 Tax=Hygrophoropsis aurantiaca TaxID=72124 RepID=A0ACB7ZP89_9AGAM|nr:hypothetical protein BJ138DRAFT_1198829 [Hygrophoropsis aurantiaca]
MFSTHREDIASDNRPTFKLSKPGGFTRRIAFPCRPGWSELAAKISSLYAIENNNIGAYYIDEDGNEVTLSSDEELQEYFGRPGMSHRLFTGNPPPRSTGQPPPVSGPRHSKTQHYLAGPPWNSFWEPPPPGDPETERFISDLKIPQISREPILLLHDLGNSVVKQSILDELFNGNSR